MRFFFDNNLSPYLAKAIAALNEPLGHEVIHKTERFPRTTPDHEWINALAQEGEWVVISHDRFGKNPLEREALRASGLKVFILKSGWLHLKAFEKASKLVRWWPRIVEQSEGIAGGAVFFVPPRFSGKGKFEQAKV